MAHESGISSVPPLATAQPTITIAIVGDVHDLWDEVEEDILVALGTDLVLFVGDFGNESVDIVRQIACLKLPKAAILGNHDVWYTTTPWRCSVPDIMGS